MTITKSTCVVFGSVIVVIGLSVTVFKNQNSSARTALRNIQAAQPLKEEDVVKRYPTAEFDEPEPTDIAKRAALKQRQLRNNGHSFSQPSPEDEAVVFVPEKNFDFPALPINESDVIVRGEVLSAKAHRSENKRNIFSEFEIRVDEVLKGRSPIVSESNVIIVERTGGFLQYPSGQKVLFRVMGYGMPELATHNVFFLKTVDQGFQIVTAYELGPNGVLPLDRSNQFLEFQGEKQNDFLTTLRNAITKPRSQ